MYMQYAVALLVLLGVLLFAVEIIQLEGERRPIERRRIPRIEAIHGCYTCALAAQGGDDTLGRHIARDHGPSGYGVLDDRLGGRNDR